MSELLRASIRGAFASRARAVATFAVLTSGIGLATGLVALANAIEFRPPMAKAAEELRYLYARADGRLQSIPYGAYRDLEDGSGGVFSHLAGSAPDSGALVGAEVLRLRGEMVTENYFETLGVAPAAGRLIEARDLADDARVVVISDALWARKFGRDPDAVGARVLLSPNALLARPTDGRGYTIIGVMPPGFAGVAGPWESTEYWAPIVHRAADRQCGDSRQLSSVTPVGRVRPGVNDARIRSFLDAIGPTIYQTHFSGRRATESWALVSEETADHRVPFGRGIKTKHLAWAAVGLAIAVLLLSLCSVVGMTAMATAGRRKEVAIRVTLGATTWTATLPFVTEALLVVAVSTGGGLIVSAWTTDLLLAGMPAEFGPASGQLALSVPLDGRVALFALASGFIAAVVLAGMVQWSTAGVAPAELGLTTPGATRPGSVNRVWKSVLAAQVALSVAVVSGTGSFVASVLRAEVAPLGFDARSLLYVQFTRAAARCLEELRAGSPERDRTTERQRLLDESLLVRGVRMAALASDMPFSSVHRVVVTAPDRSVQIEAVRSDVSDSYFKTVDARLLAGRVFGPADASAGSGVTVLTATLAAELFPAGNAIGQAVDVREAIDARVASRVQVVGIIGDSASPVEPGRIPGVVFLPRTTESASRVLLARAPGAVESDTLRTLTRLVVSSDPQAQVLSVGSIEEERERRQRPGRIVASLLALSSAFALGLAAMALYGIVAYSLHQRRRELGIRLALGAGPRRIVATVMKEGLPASLLGSALGLLLAAWQDRALSAAFVDAPDVSFVAVAGAIGFVWAVVGVSSYLPARSATRIDPSSTLQSP